MKMMIGVMQVQCCVSSASDQKDLSIPIKAVQCVGQLIQTGLNKTDCCLANKDKNIIVLVVLCVFEGAGMNAILLDLCNYDFQVVENCMPEIWIVPTELLSIHTVLWAMEISEKNNSMLCMSCPCCQSSLNRSFVDWNIDQTCRLSCLSNFNQCIVTTMFHPDMVTKK